MCVNTFLKNEFYQVIAPRLNALTKGEYIDWMNTAETTNVKHLKNKTILTCRTHLFQEFQQNHSKPALMAFPVDVSPPNERSLSTHGTVTRTHLHSKIQRKPIYPRTFCFIFSFTNHVNDQHKQRVVATCRPSGSCTVPILVPRKHQVAIVEVPGFFLCPLTVSLKTRKRKSMALYSN